MSATLRTDTATSCARRISRSSGRISLDLTVLPVFALIVRLGPQVDLILVAVIAEEQDLPAVSNQNERNCGEGASIILLN